MTGKQIADNLRQNRDRWGRYRYFDSASKSYCVIGLKLSELGVPVETWANQDLGIGTMTESLCPIELVRLQNANDSSGTVDQLIALCETPEWAVTNFPLEELAEEFKRRSRAALFQMAQKEGGA